VTTLLYLEPHSAPITHVTSRIILTLTVIVVVAFALWGMRRGWLGKAKQFDDLPVPMKAPATLSVPITENFEARFAGSTISGKWLQRITVHDLGTPRSVVASVHNSGILVTDEADFRLWISRDSISHIRTGRGIAGDVVEPDGMTIITWTLGDQLIDSGIRIARHGDHEIFLKAAIELVNGVSA